MKPNSSLPNPMEDTNNLLEHSLVSNDANHKTTHSLLENNLEMSHNHTQQVVPLLENQLEMQDKTVKTIEDNGSRVVEAVKELSSKLDPKEVGDGATFIVKGVKGDKGDKGDTPVVGKDFYTPEEIASVIKEITDSIRVPEDGITPSTEAIRALVDDAIALIPKPTDGEDGVDGTDGEDSVIDYEKIISEVLAKLPKSKKITATVQAPITAEEILIKIKGVLSYNDLKDLPTIFKERMAGTGYLREITDVEIISEPTNGQALAYDTTKKKWTPKTISGGSGGQVVAGTGISVNSTDPVNPIVTNSAPDQTVAISAGTNITSVTGTYPNFTINAATQGGSYTLPTASASVLGGVKIGSRLTMTGDTLSADIQSGGTGTVTSVSVATANGFSGTVATDTTTPAITIIAGAITPSSVNSVVLSGASTPTLAVTGTTTVSGSNTGDNSANSTYAIGSQTQAYNANLTAINQALTTTSSPSFTTVTAALTGIASGNALPALSNLASVAMNASLQFDNTAARTFDIAPTANTVVGRALTISAGSTVTAGTADMAGGNLILNSGLGKGTGASSIIFQTGRTLTTGSTLQTLTTAMTILGSGNVGIGTTSPGAKLEVVDVAANPGFKFTTSEVADNWVKMYPYQLQMNRVAGSNAGLELLTTNTGAWGATGGYIAFKPNNAEAMRILNNGNVGIGTTGPGELLSLGTAGTTAGVLSLAGLTSGKAIIVVPSVAGTPTLTLPTVTGTLATLAGTETLTNKTIDGVTPTVMGYVDPTSSIQTQLNSKQASGAYLTTVDISANTNLAVTAPIVLTGDTLSIPAATASVNGYATSTQITKLDGIATSATANAKITGATLDSLTDDTGFVTALAVQNGHNVPHAVPGTTGNLLQSNGTDWLAVAVPTWNQNTTGTAATVTGAAQTAITSLGLIADLRATVLGVNGGVGTSSYPLVVIVPDSGAMVLQGASGVANSASMKWFNATVERAFMTWQDTTNFFRIATISGGFGFYADNITGRGMTIDTTTGQVNLGLAGTIAGVLALDGVTSGKAKIVVAAAAGTPTLTLPTVTGTLATLAGTETFTNKTLTSPIFTAPALGTPASGVLTNTTGLPAASVVAGVLGVTGTRMTKLWATDIESTNMPTVGGTAILTSLTAPQFTTIELGAATDTTISRVSAGVIAVEGSTVPTLSVANTFTANQSFNQILNVQNVITASGNAATVPITYRLNEVTNNSAATITITMATTSAVDGQMVMVKVLPSSAAAQTITWVNTENSTVTAPILTSADTTLPVTAGFQFNSATTKWRCIASA